MSDMATPGIGEEQFKAMMKDFDPDALTMDEELDGPMEKEVIDHHIDEKIDLVNGREDDDQEDPGGEEPDGLQAVEAPAGKKNLREEALTLHTF